MTLERENQTLTRRYYRALVLNAVRRYGTISRVQLQKITGIRLASITELVKDLVAEGLLEEAGVSESARGRKQVLMRLNPESGFVVGVEFDANRVIALAVDMTSRVVGRSRSTILADANRDTILAAIQDAIREMIGQAWGDEKKLMGIGVADPGLIDSKRGISIFASTIQDWREVPVKAILEEAFDVPVMMEANTRTKTLCEKRFGAGREAENFLFIEYGAGIGCGLMLGGKIFHGLTESAGELGHMRVMENGPVCNCGSYGCLETVASMPALASQAVRAMRAGAMSKILELAGGDLAKVKGEHVFEAARQGDKLALGILDKAAEYFGIGVAGAINLFNPEMVIFDSQLGQVAELMLEPVRKVIQRQALAVSTKHLRLEVSKMGEEGGALGAAVLVLDQVFEIPQFEVPAYVRV